MKVLAIVQARMGSTRLPGKILKQVNGKSLLEYQIERMKRAKNIDQLVVSTSSLKADDLIIDLCQKLNVDTFRGSEKDVLGRYYETSSFYKGEVIVRLTADCPLIDPEVIDGGISLFLKNYPKFLYVSNTRKRSYPRGMDTEVFSYQLLQDAFMNANMPHDLEHVTPFMIKRIDSSAVGQFVYHRDESKHRWTVDTMEDFALIEKILSTLYPSKPKFSMEDVLDLLERNQEWLRINEKVKQKEDGTN
ncbi:cytidylyltransferase domain-containing protein [Halobacillus sp. K22]|uniref:cytidylyltransferase domain-containing protein n=1 Tax=Halobacillus sp. K22 TaxID=3457431 RepID=UPI003FCE7239